MNHLAIDSATEILSVALRCDRGSASDRFVAVRDAGLRHTKRLMVLVDELLSEAGLKPADLDLVSCTRGPGSFTGLRIGMATTKGLAWAIAGARDLDQPPLVSVPTLDAIAGSVASRRALVVPVIDGKKGRFYGAGYLAGRRLCKDLDLEAAELLAVVRAAARADGESAVPATAEPPLEVIATGPHAARFVEACGTSVTRGVVVDPSSRAGWADSVLRLAEARLGSAGYDPVDLGPDYVRGSDAEITRASGPSV